MEKFIKKKLLNHFNGIYKACDNTFWYGCGSYLFDGLKYKYDPRMLKKQQLLFHLAKQNKSILEVGVYMGHSMLIMLLSNPKLKICGIDIDKTYSPPAVNYLKKNFLNAKINLISGDSINNLKKINKKFDLYHIDGDHSPHKIYKEIIECIRINKNKKIKILFDDIDMMKGVEEKIFEYFTVIKFIRPNCRYKNLYVELIIEKKQLQKFKNYYYRFVILDLPERIWRNTKPFLKQNLRNLLKMMLGRKLCNYIGNILCSAENTNILYHVGKKLKNIK